MYRYFVFLLNMWLVSASEPTDEEIQFKNRSPLLLTPYQDFYYFPVKARITKNQTQEFYLNKKKDVRFFCPMETEIVEENTNQEQEQEQQEQQHKFQFQFKSRKDLQYKNCLIEKKFKEKERKICKREVKPMIVPRITYMGKVPCGKTGFRYKMAYKRGASEKIFHPLTYEVCYDHSSNSVLYTYHKIKSTFILQNVNLEQENAQHDFPQEYSTENYGLEDLNNLPKILEAFEKQTNHANEQVLQMLVPIEDFALGHWIKTTFHIMNCGFMHKSKAAVWREVNSHVTERLIKLNKKMREVRIFTGTSGEQYSGKQKLYLGNDQKLGITIPKIWWKLLYSANFTKGIVIIMHNVDGLQKICEEEESACDVTKWVPDGLKKEHFEYVYCCRMSSASASIMRLNHISEIDLSHDPLILD